MGRIRKRVIENGHRTDGFLGLEFKAYLITDVKNNGNDYNSYAPLYIWKNAQGMNKFIFEGYYNNIIESFGWQHIHIGVVLTCDLENNFNKSKYVAQYAGHIPEVKSFGEVTFKNTDTSIESLGNIIVYNPDKWGYSSFNFYQDKPNIETTTMYEILHISQ